MFALPNFQKVLTVVTDVSKRADCKNLIDKTLEKFKAIDVLFLNAGVSQAAKVKDSTPEVLDQVSTFPSLALRLQDHEDQLLWCCRHRRFCLACSPCLQGTHRCYLLRCSKIGNGWFVKLPSEIDVLGTSAYCASKAAVSAFFDCLRIEECRAGVKVTVLCPGFVPTGVVENSLTGTGEKFGKTKSLPFRMELGPAVQLAIDAVASNKLEVWYTLPATIIMMLRGFAPNLCDRLMYKVR